MTERRDRDCRRRQKDRTRKQKDRWMKRLSLERHYRKQIIRAGQDILSSHNFRKTAGFIQHGNMTVQHHCMNVAKYSLFFSDKLGIKCCRDEMVRGALLHDYFLYDWHEKKKDMKRRLHGFYHPGIALANADKEYSLTPREKDIIQKHMWPLTVKVPLCREAWLVTAADKWCSLMETFYLHKGHGVRHRR